MAFITACVSVSLVNNWFCQADTSAVFMSPLIYWQGWLLKGNTAVVEWTWLSFFIKAFKISSFTSHQAASTLNQTLCCWWPNLFHLTSFSLVGLFFVFHCLFLFFSCMVQTPPLAFPRMGPLLSMQPSWVATWGQWRCSSRQEQIHAWGTRYVLAHHPPSWGA